MLLKQSVHNYVNSGRKLSGIKLILYNKDFYILLAFSLLKLQLNTIGLLTVS
jgi:hypothetical protein